MRKKYGLKANHFKAILLLLWKLNVLEGEVSRKNTLISSIDQSKQL